MKYTRSDFSKELASELAKGYDIVRLSRWAMSVYLAHCRETDADLDKVIMAIVSMEDDPQFELSEKQLRELVDELQRD